MKYLYAAFLTMACAFETYAQDLSQILEKVSPAVFKITTYDAANKELALGTGFFITSTGTALTNYHVLKGATKVKIKTADNKTYLVDNVVSWSKESDMLKFTVTNELNETFPFIKLSGTTPKAGERIFTVGSPLGLDKTVSDGIVSSVRMDDAYGETIQVTAPISQGNSGSPLVNMQGEAIGVMTYYLQSGQNLNFAVSVKNMNVLEPVQALKFPSAENATKSLDKTSNNIDSYSEPNSTLYYANSSVKFCTLLDASQQPQNANTLFYIGSDGSWVYVFVKNEKPLATSELIVDVFRKRNGASDEFVETKRFTVEPAWYDTHFKYSFFQAGDYKVSVYTADEAWINTGYVNIQASR